MKSKPNTFNATRMALAAAVGDYINEPEKTIDEMLDILRHADGEEPPLNVVEERSGLSGKQLLKEIRLTEQGYRGLMEIAYNAAKLNQEFV